MSVWSSGSGHSGGRASPRIIGAVVLAALLWVGVRLLWAGRQLDDIDARRLHRIPVAPSGSVAAKVDRRLQRTRAALETLVMPEVEQEELHPSAGAFRDRAQTYVVPRGRPARPGRDRCVIGFLLTER